MFQSNSSKDIICPNSFDALLIRKEQLTSTSSPKPHDAHSELANMLIQHIASIVCSIPILKSLMDTLDNSKYHEVLAQSVGQFGELRDGSGQQLISTGSDQNMDTMVVSTPMHSTYNFDAKSDQRGGTSARSMEEEEQVIHPTISNKLSPIDSSFVPSCTMIVTSLAAGQILAQTSAPNSKIGNEDLLQDAYFYEESDEDEMLVICFANAARTLTSLLGNKAVEKAKVIAKLMVDIIVGMIKCLENLFRGN